MKTEHYNPSTLEVELTHQLAKLTSDFEAGLSSNKIIEISSSLNMDNPRSIVKTKDDDGDPHEIVLKIIHRPDKF